MFRKLLLSLLFAALLCGTVHADLVYEYSNYGQGMGIRSITQNGSAFSQGQDVSLGASANDTYVCSFTHGGQNRIHVSSIEIDDDEDASWSGYANSFTLRVYDPANLSSPLVQKNLGSSGLGLMGISSVAEFGNNILVSGMGFQSAVIAEINPETLDVVNTYRHFGMSDFSTDDFSFFVSAVAVYNGTIYAAFMHQISDLSGNNDNYNDRVDFVTMSSVGNVTARHENFSLPNSFAGMAFSGGSFYVGIGSVSAYRADDSSKYGIYRVNSINPSEAVRVLEGDINHLCTDGNGGFYYTLNEEESGGSSGNSYNFSGMSRTVYHWNGSAGEQVYQSSSSYINDMQYDTSTNTLFIMLSDRIMAVINGNASQAASFSAGFVDYFAVVGPSPYASGTSSSSNPSTPSTQPDSSGGNSNVVPDSGSGNSNAVPDSSGGNSNAVPDSGSTTTTGLPSGVIEPAVITSTDILARLAALVSTDASSIHLISYDNITEPQEPTQSMKDYMKNDGYEAAYKFNTVTVSNDGYYVFMINVPDELVGTKISDIRIYAMNSANVSGSKANASFMSLINGLLNYGELTNLFGVKIDTLEKQILAVGFLQAGTPFSVYLAKILIALLAGGCESGLGIAALCVLCFSLLRLRK